MIWVYIIGTAFLLIGFSAFFGAPYVPTRRRDLRRMFDSLFPIGEGDVLLDIGSGDGLVLREARRRGARAVGFEINPLLVGISRMLAKGDAGQQTLLVNGWFAPFPDDVTIVYVFSVGRDAKRLIKTMQREADRLGRPLSLVCFGSPLQTRQPSKSFEAYFLYEFRPLQSPQA